MGGIEFGANHFPLIVLLHAAWLGAMAIAIPPDTAVDWPILALYGALQLVRYWVIVTLGRHWTTRIIVIPGSVRIRRGPYRLMRHPNYAVVIGEIALLPLAFGAWQLALIFSVLNGLLIVQRIRVEDAALDTHCLKQF